MTVLSESRGITKRRDGNAEARVQAAIIEYLRTCAPQLIAFHVPNGGLRSKSEAARLKWMGVVAGVPDLCVVIPGGAVRFIEVKAAGGSLSHDQSQMIVRLVGIGAECIVAKSIDDVRDGLKRWGIETREVAP